MKDRIKMVRKSVGLNQTDFGERIGVKQNTVALYESGSREPSNSVLALICNSFNVNEEWLRTGAGEMFVPITKNQEIALFLERVSSMDDQEFIKRLSLALARMGPSGWDAVEKFIDELK